MNGNIITVKHPQYQQYVRKRKTDSINSFKKAYENKEPKASVSLPSNEISPTTLIIASKQIKDPDESLPSPENKAFLQLANAQSTIAFLKKEHEFVLKGLQDQVAELQQKCRDLQFSRTFKLPYIPKEVQQHISELENLVEEKEMECIDLRKDILLHSRKEDELRKELFFKEQAIIKLRKEVSLREHAEQQLKQQLEAALKEKGASTSNVARCERSRSVSSVFEWQNPMPPPKSTKDKSYSRPLSLYRRLLNLSSRSFSLDSTPPLLPASCPSLPQSESIQTSDESSSSIPHLPQLVNLTNGVTGDRPLIRQQLRLNKFSSDLKCQPVILNNVALPKYHSLSMHSEEGPNGF